MQHLSKPIVGYPMQAHKMWYSVYLNTAKVKTYEIFGLTTDTEYFHRLKAPKSTIEDGLIGYQPSGCLLGHNDHDDD